MARSDEDLFAQVFELGRILGWHDGSARSRHQEYVDAYTRKVRRVRAMDEDALLIKHADALNHALFTASLAGGELSALVLEQQQDDKPYVRRPRHVIGIDEPAAVLALLRRSREAA